MSKPGREVRLSAGTVARYALAIGALVLVALVTFSVMSPANTLWKQEVSLTSSITVPTPTPTPTPTPPPTPSITLVQTAHKNSDPSAAWATASLSVKPTAGNLMVAIIGSSSGNPDFQMVLPGTTNVVDPSWTLAYKIRDDASGQAFFYKIAGANEALTVTGRRTSGSIVGLQYFEYSGVTTLGQTAVGTNGVAVSRNGGAFTCGTVATTGPAVVLAGIALEQAAGVNLNDAWSGGFVERWDQNGPTSVHVGSADQIVGSAGTYSTGSTVQGGTNTGRTRCMTVVFTP